MCEAEPSDVAAIGVWAIFLPHSMDLPPILAFLAFGLCCLFWKELSPAFHGRVGISWVVTSSVDRSRAVLESSRESHCQEQPRSVFIGGTSWVFFSSSFLLFRDIPPIEKIIAVYICILKVIMIRALFFERSF